ncbi:MAG: 30S ribosomal protein S11 [Patescibacteria group bacterium]
MGKRRILKKHGSGIDSGKRERALSKVAKRIIDRAILHVDSSYNNTRLTLTDRDGNAVMWSSSGSLGFSGNRKSTPFAAAKVGEVIGEKAAVIGVKEADVFIRGVGSGRESALRAFAAKGIQILSIHDITPVPHNGPRPRKPRRV